MRVKYISEPIEFGVNMTKNKIYHVVKFYNFANVGTVYELFDDMNKKVISTESNFIEIKQHRREILNIICE